MLSRDSTYLELVAAANSGDGEARAELAIVERRMLNQGASAAAQGGDGIATDNDNGNPPPGL